MTVRLIDPPLHEFLPSLEELLVETTELRVKGETGAEYQAKMQMLGKVRDLHEHNPMLGLRGVRLSIYFPGIVKMQIGGHHRRGLRSEEVRHRRAPGDHDPARRHSSPS